LDFKKHQKCILKFNIGIILFHGKSSVPFVFLSGKFEFVGFGFESVGILPESVMKDMEVRSIH